MRQAAVHVCAYNPDCSIVSYSVSEFVAGEQLTFSFHPHSPHPHDAPPRRAGLETAAMVVADRYGNMVGDLRASYMSEEIHNTVFQRSATGWSVRKAGMPGTGPGMTGHVRITGRKRHLTAGLPARTCRGSMSQLRTLPTRQRSLTTSVVSSVCSKPRSRCVSQRSAHRLSRTHMLNLTGDGEGWLPRCIRMLRERSAVKGRRFAHQGCRATLLKRCGGISKGRSIRRR
jgi:hypothetical protein